MKALPFMLALAMAGCVNATITCPDKTSTVTYRGVALTGNTVLSCVGSPLGGDMVSVSGMDLLALAAAVAPLVALQKAPAAQPTPRAEPAPPMMLEPVPPGVTIDHRPYDVRAEPEYLPGMTLVEETE